MSRKGVDLISPDIGTLLLSPGTLVSGAARSAGMLAIGRTTEVKNDKANEYMLGVGMDMARVIPDTVGYQGIGRANRRGTSMV